MVVEHHDDCSMHNLVSHTKASDQVQWLGGMGRDDVDSTEGNILRLPQEVLAGLVSQ